MEGTTSLEREIARLRDEIALSPRNLELKLKYGHACLVHDWRLESLRVFQEVLHEGENAQARLALAKIYALQEYYPEAYDELRKLFNIDPMNLQGHVLLHMLKEYETVPADLKQHLEFVPNRQFLQQHCGALLADRDLLDSQIAEYTAMVFGVTDPEPMAQYCVLEARKCKERLNKFLDKCQEWGRSAMDGVPFNLEEQVVSGIGASVNEVGAGQEDETFMAGSETDAAYPDMTETEPVTAGGGEDILPVTDDAQSEAAEQAPGAERAEGEGTPAEQRDVPGFGEWAAASDGDAAGETVGEGSQAVATEENAPQVAAEQTDAAEVVSEDLEAMEEKAEEVPVDNSKFLALLESFNNNRGVKSVILFQEDRGVVALAGESAPTGTTLLAVSECMKAWHELHNTMNCWVLEGKQGRVYIHRLNAGHIVIIDSSSTNTGALRLSINKLVPSLNELIQ